MSWYGGWVSQRDFDPEPLCPNGKCACRADAPVLFSRAPSNKTGGNNAYTPRRRRLLEGRIQWMAISSIRAVCFYDRADPALFFYSGLGITIVIKMLLVKTCQRTMYKSFYRTKPRTANFSTLALGECNSQRLLFKSLFMATPYFSQFLSLCSS